MKVETDAVLVVFR